MKTENQTGAVILKKQGPPSVLNYTTIAIGQPKADEVLIEHEAVALNFVDVMFRNGSFPLSTLPAIIGVEAAGIVKAAGDQVPDLRVGDRVGYFFSLGAYAQRRLIRAKDLIKLPASVTFDQAAAILAKGLTARMLIQQAYAVKRGDVVLVHAAAGGVGSLVSRWAKALGATVIGTVGRAAKKDIALSHGIDHVVSLDSEDLQSTVLSVTQGKGVDVVYDGVGKATFNNSLPLVKNGGSIILYGTASGEPDINRAELETREMNFLRPALGAYLPNRTAVDQAAADVFEALQSGVFGEIKPAIYRLEEAAQAHTDLESGQTTGSIIFHVK